MYRFKGKWAKPIDFGEEGYLYIIEFLGGVLIGMFIAMFLDMVTLFVPSHVWLMVWIFMAFTPLWHFLVGLNSVYRGMSCDKRNAVDAFLALPKKNRNEFPSDTIETIRVMNDDEAYKFRNRVNDINQSVLEMERLDPAGRERANLLIDKAQVESHVHREAVQSLRQLS